MAVNEAWSEIVFRPYASTNIRHMLTNRMPPLPFVDVVEICTLIAWLGRRTRVRLDLETWRRLVSTPSHRSASILRTPGSPRE